MWLLASIPFWLSGALASLLAAAIWTKPFIHRRPFTELDREHMSTILAWAGGMFAIAGVLAWLQLGD
jgi:hypothetical protein